MLLAACGGGSGGNLTTSSGPEPRPPGTGPLTATGDGDGENEEKEEKVVTVKKPEEKKIVVNIQPDNQEPEEESESEEEEEQQQQLTIIEEEDFPYVPPEEQEPRYSAQTQTQTQGSGQASGNSLARPGGLPEPQEIKNCTNAQDEGVNCADYISKTGNVAGMGYELENAWFADGQFDLTFKGANRALIADIINFNEPANHAFNPSHASYSFAYKNIDRHKKIEVTYTKQNGFHGVYSYKGSSSHEMQEDVTLKATFFDSLINPTAIIHGYIGDDNGITMGGTNFGQIRFSANDVSEDGQFIDSNQISFSKKNITVEKGFNELRGSFKNDGSTTSFPTQVVGELKMKRFYDGSPLMSNPNEYTNNLYSRGDNALAGVFVADKASEVTQSIAPIKIDAIEGTIGMFGYGLWASENFLDNKIVFLEETEKFNPGRTASDYTSHITATGSNPLRYKKKDGFKGVYIYEGETGELTGDVELELHFDSNKIRVIGDISRSLEIEGENLYGIGIRSTIDFTTGVGGSLESSALLANPRLRFGVHDSDWDLDITEIDDHGQAKLKMVLSPDGIQAQTGVPETYPSQIAGELEINGFKIEASDGDNNTVVGVFVADKQE